MHLLEYHTLKKVNVREILIIKVPGMVPHLGVCVDLLQMQATRPQGFKTFHAQLR